MDWRYGKSLITCVHKWKVISYSIKDEIKYFAAPVWCINHIVLCGVIEKPGLLTAMVTSYICGGIMCACLRSASNSGCDKVSLSK